MNDETLRALYAEEMDRYIWRQRSMETMRNLSALILALMAIATFVIPMISSQLILFLGSLSVFALFIFETRVEMVGRASELRIALFEKNFFVPILDPENPPTDSWKQQLAASYLSSKPAIGFLEAFATRLRESYFIIFLGLDSCWFSKLYIFPNPPQSLDEFIHRMDFGPASGWIVSFFIVVLWTTYVVLLVWLRGREQGKAIVH